MARHVCPMCAKVFGTNKQLKNHTHTEITGVIDAVYYS